MIKEKLIMSRIAGVLLPIGVALLINSCTTQDPAPIAPPLGSMNEQLAYCGRLMGEAAQSVPADSPESAAYAKRVGRVVAATGDADDKDIDAGVQAAETTLQTATTRQLAAERTRCSALIDDGHAS